MIWGFPVTSALSASPGRATDIAHRLADHVGKSKFRLWFESAHFRVDHRTLHVTVPNRFVGDWIDTHFHDQLMKFAHNELGPEAQIQVTVDPACAAEPAAVPARHAADHTPKHAAKPTASHHATATATPAAPVAIAPLPDPATLAASEPLKNAKALRYELDSFIVGPSNELAFTAATRLVTDPDARMNPLFIHGGCGLGKTHLLQGLCKRYLQLHPSAKWSYTTAEHFTNQYIQAVRTNRLGDFRKRLRSLELLAVDDVHFLSNKSATQTEFLHTFDAIDLHGAKLVLASDAHPKLIEQMTDSLVSRFMSGMVVRVEAPDRATRLSVIQSLAKRRGLLLLDQAAQMLADQPAKSVRELEGMVTRLAALASVVRPGKSDHPIGHALIAQFVHSDAPAMSHRPVRLEQIITATCQHLRVERAQMISKSRHKRIVLARSLVIHLARQLTTLSFPELARALSRPNHSTIVTAAQRAAEQVKTRSIVTIADDLAETTMDQLADQIRQSIAAGVGLA